MTETNWILIIGFGVVAYLLAKISDRLHDILKRLNVIANAANRQFGGDNIF